MLFTEPKMGMTVCRVSCEGQVTSHKGRITALRLQRNLTDMSGRNHYAEVQVTWTNGSSEWVPTASLSASRRSGQYDVPSPSPVPPKRMRFPHRPHVPKTDSAVERWRKDRRRTMKTIVVSDIESMAIACDKEIQAAVNATSAENWRVNAELLRLAVEVLKETKRERRRPRVRVR